VIDRCWTRSRSNLLPHRVQPTTRRRRRGVKYVWILKSCPDDVVFGRFSSLARLQLTRKRLELSLRVGSTINGSRIQPVDFCTSPPKSNTTGRSLLCLTLLVSYSIDLSWFQTILAVEMRWRKNAKLASDKYRPNTNRTRKYARKHALQLSQWAL